MIILDNVGVSLSTSNQQPVNGDPGKNSIHNYFPEEFDMIY